MDVITGDLRVFAGTDARICFGSGFLLSEASAENAISFSWSVLDGGGSFLNSNTLKATYTPSASDVGKVITLRLEVGDGSGNAITDDVFLAVFPSVSGDLGIPEDAVQTVCGNGSQNKKAVVINNRPDPNSGLSYSWSHDGHGYLENSSSFSPQYVVNRKDRGNTVKLKITALDAQNRCMDGLLDLEVLGEQDFSITIDGELNPWHSDARSIHFSLVERNSFVPIKNGDNAGDNLLESDELIELNGVGDIRNRLLVDIELDDLPVESQLSNAFLYFYFSEGGEFESGDFELIPIRSEWNPETVTWNDQEAFLFDRGEDNQNVISSHTSGESTPKEILDDQGNVIKTVRRRWIRFDISPIVRSWYEGDLLNRGFMLKLVDEASDLLVHFNRRSAQYPNSSVYLGVQADSPHGVYVCREKETSILVSSSNANQVYSWDWSGADYVGLPTTGAELNLPNCLSPVNEKNISRSFVLEVDDELMCPSLFRFLIHPSPVIFTSPRESNIIGSNLCTVPVFHRNRLDIDKLSWDIESGAGSTKDPGDVDVQYLPVEADFGKTVVLKATAMSTMEECDYKEVVFHDIHVRYPLMPEAGADVAICKGSSVEMLEAKKADDKYELYENENSWVGSIRWSCNPPEAGTFDDVFKEKPRFTPSDDFSGIVVCTMTVGDIQEPTWHYVSDQMRIHYISEPTVDLGAYSPVKVGDELLLHNVIASNYATFEWSCSGAGTFTGVESLTPSYIPSFDDIQDVSYTNLEENSVTFTLKATGLGDCGYQVVQSVEVLILPPIDADAGEDVTLCSGDQVDLFATGGERYLWILPDGTEVPTENEGSLRVTPEAGATYRVKVFETFNTTEYFLQDEVVVSVNSLPDVNAGENMTVCYGENTNLEAQQFQNVSYLWSPLNNNLSCRECPAPFLHAVKTQTYTLTVTDKNNCSAQDFVEVNVVNGGDVIVNDGAVSCDGHDIEVSATGYSSFQWTPESCFECSTCASATLIKPLQSNSYTFVGEKNGCRVEKEFEVSLGHHPVITGSNSYSVCPGNSVTFDLNDTGDRNTYIWKPSASLSSSSVLNPVATPTESTVYQLITIGESGCSSERNVYVDVNMISSLNLGDDITICNGESADVSIGNQASWIKWEPESGLSNANGFFNTVSPNVTTEYTITIGNGDCSTSDGLLVEVIQESDARFTYSYPGLEVNFAAVGEAESYLWDFGDDSGIDDYSGRSVTHIYSEGTYNVCLTINGRCGPYKYCTSVRVDAPDEKNCE